VTHVHRSGSLAQAPPAYRDATAADVPAVVALVDSAYRGDASRQGWTTEADLIGGQRTDAAAVADTIAAPDCRILLAEAAGDLVGCCMLERRAAQVAYFGMFAIRPDRQGAGLGRALLAQAERIAAEEFGATLMVMTVIRQRMELIAWYERLGYALTGEREPFPYGNERYGLPMRPDLEFVVLARPLEARAGGVR
jgi:ribosomal protein S18 acetylase RimI-like enzyme